MTWVPSFMQGMAAYLKNPNVSGMFGMWDAQMGSSDPPAIHPDGTIGPGEGGVDLVAPIGTPVYALADGQVVGAGYWNDIAHGVVTTRVNVPGVGAQDLYYQHIVLDPSIKQCMNGTCTQTVKKGQKIGVVGQYGETEMGFNAKWGGIWGANHPGPWAVDPRPMLAALLTGSAPDLTSGSSSSSSSSSSSGSSSSSSSSSDWTTQFHTEGIKIGIFLLATTLIGFGVYLLFQKQADAMLKKVGSTAVKAAAA